jgi:hypothetical protein
MSVPPSSSDETEAILENIKEDGSFDRLRQQLISLVKASVSRCSRMLRPPSPRLQRPYAMFCCHHWRSNDSRMFLAAAGLPGSGQEADGRQRSEAVIDRGRSGRTADDGVPAE